MRDLVCIYMKQVVAGPMTQYAFYSGQFSSCSPLFAFNRTTKFGAYYHVPGRGGSGDHTQDEEACRAIVHAVKPDYIWVFPPGDHAQAGSCPFFAANIAGSDVDGLKRLLSSVKVAQGIKYVIDDENRPTNRLLAYLGSGGLPRFSQSMREGGPYRAVYDPKVSKKRPPGCGVKSWLTDLRLWDRLS